MSILRGKEKIVKKGKWINIAIGIGLGVLVLLVIITSIVLHTKQTELDDLKEKNDIVTPDTSVNLQENKIILKNFEIFIDNSLDF